MATKKIYKYTLPIGYKLQGGENDYEIEEVLGKGGYGVTYKVKATIFVKKIPFDVHFAVKEYFPDICSREADNATIKIPETKHDEIVDGIKDFINEGRKLQDVCDLNPNIVNVNEVFEANGTAYYVLEYLEGGNLRKMVKNNGGALTEHQMLEVMMPIGRAVQCLHDNNILHLYIKPDNIVMRRNSNSKEEPVLIDFGIAVHFRLDGTPTSKRPAQGISPGYSPIEQYSLIRRFDPRLDVYSFSATCLYLLTGKDPMEAFDMTPALLRNEIPQDLSSNVASAIEHGMSKDKISRIGTINEVLEDMGEDESDDDIIVEPELISPTSDKTVNLNAKAAANNEKNDKKPLKIASATPKESSEKDNQESKQESLSDTPKSNHSTTFNHKSTTKFEQTSTNSKNYKKKKRNNDSIILFIVLAISFAAVAALMLLPKACSNSNTEKDITYMKQRDVWNYYDIKTDQYKTFFKELKKGNVQNLIETVNDLQTNGKPVNGYLLQIYNIAKDNPKLVKEILSKGSIDIQLDFIETLNELRNNSNNNKDLQPQNEPTKENQQDQKTQEPISQPSYTPA